MRKDHIKNKLQAYQVLFNDMKFEIINNDVAIRKPGNDDYLYLTNAEDMSIFYDKLDVFVITYSDKAIISYRYGLDSLGGHSLRATGYAFNLSDEQIRSVIQKSFRKLKHRLNLTRTIERWREGI